MGISFDSRRVAFTRSQATGVRKANLFIDGSFARNHPYEMTNVKVVLAVVLPGSSDEVTL